MRQVTHGRLNKWTDIFILRGSFLNPNNATLNLCKTLRKYIFRHAKGRSRVNFYIVNTLDQNLADSESFPILRFLQEAKI